ncbi:MAG: hypothetical protein JNL98_40280 [Bryobacterales bacterium]|nr:hypothetical protein [Bryobacterales bacterium]
MPAILASLILIMLQSGYGQTGQTPDGISVAAGQRVPVNPTQAKYAAAIFAPHTMPFEEVLAAISSSGLTAAHLAAAGLGWAGRFQPPEWWDYSVPYTLWMFEVVESAANLEATLARLTRAAAEIKTNSSSRVGLTFRLVYQGPSPAENDAARRAAWPELAKQLRQKAEGLAAAAGTSLEPVAWISTAIVSRAGSLSESALWNRDSSILLNQDTWLSLRYGPALPLESGISVNVVREEPATSHILLGLTLTTPEDVTLTNALQILQPLGIGLGDLVSSGYPFGGFGPPEKSVNFSFQRTIPLREHGPVITAMEKFSKDLAKPMVLSFGVSGLTMPAAEFEARRQVVWGEMLQEARAEAQALARALGVQAGGVLSVAESANTYGWGGASPMPHHSLTARFAIRR